MEQLIRRTITLVESMKDEEMVKCPKDLETEAGLISPTLVSVARIAWSQLCSFLGYEGSDFHASPAKVRVAAAEAKKFLEALDKANPPDTMPVS